MSELLLFKRYKQNIKLQTVLGRISDTAYQGWIQIYGLLFWLFSVSINHWKLKKAEKISIDYSSLFDSGRKPLCSFISEHGTQNRSKKRPKSSSISSSSDTLQSKPKLSPPTVILKKDSSNSGNDANRKKSPSRQSEKKSTKQSLSLKSHMLSWRQKLNHSQPSSPVALTPAKSLSSSLPSKVSPNFPKRSFLRRLSSANSSVYNDSVSICSGNSVEPSSPTTSSILKSISFKLKKQDSVMMTENKSTSSVVDYNGNSGSRRLSLTNFRRKTYPDIIIK